MQSMNERPKRSVDFPPAWSASRCTVESCQRYCLWLGDELKYPANGSSALPLPAAAMPAEVRDLYEEAALVFGVSRRAGAALARATLEALLRHVDPNAGKANLDERMARMEGRLSTTLWDTLDLVRHVGNKALHVSGAPDEAVILVLDEADSDVGPALFEIINDVVDETIVKEQKRARLANLIPSSVRDGVERVRNRVRDTTSIGEPSEQNPPAS
ncbi:MAG: hypothetical protein DI639_05400 [Leifsonia xyli]|nr:MAG: hypothetical protein DI639_05400 [Leifsonia xyli]